MFRLCLSCSFVGIHSDFYPPHTDLFDVSPGLLLLLLGSLIPRSHSLCVCRLFRFSKQLSCLQGGLPSGCPATALSNATCYWLLQSFIAKDISWLLFVYAQVVAGYFYRTTEGKQKCLKKKVRTNYIRIHAVRSRFIIIAHCSSNLFLCFLCCDEYPIVDLQCEFFFVCCFPSIRCFTMMGHTSIALHAHCHKLFFFLCFKIDSQSDYNEIFQC